MNDTDQHAPRSPVIPAFSRDALLCLYQHRLLSSRQLHQMLVPAAADSSYPRRELRRLQAAGWIDGIASGSRWKQRLWFLTSTGVDIVEASHEVPHRPFRMSAEKAAGPLQEHMIAVAETGLAFLHTARRLGHQMTALDWTPEVFHRLTDGRSDQPENLLIVDALLNYTVHARDGSTSRQLQLFLEVDRSTYSVARLAEKLVRYARYHRFVPHAAQQGPPAHRDHRPGWQGRYPRFPRILVILAGVTTAQARMRRIQDLRAQAAARPILKNLAGEMLVAATTLEQLQDAGPFAPIFVPILGADETPADLFLQGRRAA